MQQITLESKDNYRLSLQIYETDKPAGVVRIIHGMMEHQARYEDFAEYLAKHGYIVVTSDMRGHGSSAPVLSHIADRDGDKRLIEDENVIRDMISSKYPDLPVILFAHSMGSIIARKVLQRDSGRYDKVILSGYVNPQRAASFGVLLTKLIGLIRSPKGHSALLTSLAVGPFAAAIPDAEPHELRWLSYNEDNIARFISDPLCGKEFSVGSYNALFHLVADIARPRLYKNVRTDLPILLISGKDDPCTGFDKGRAKSLSVLRKAGFSDIKTLTLTGMRHEILNEKENHAVYEKILHFIDNSHICAD